MIRNAAFRNSQSSPAAAAAANIVVRTSVANCSMAFMTCLPTWSFGNGTAPANLNALTTKDLLARKGY